MNKKQLTTNEDKKTKKRKYDETKMTLSKVVSKVKKLEKKIEKKGLTFQYTGSQVDSTTGAIASFALQCVQGSGQDQRIGNDIYCKYIQFNLWCYVNNTTVAGQGAFDIIIDRSPTGVLPLITDIFSNGDPTRLILYNKKDRFKSIVHEHFTYDLNTLSSEGKVFQGYRNLKGMNIHYTASAGAISDLTSGKNDILLVWRSSNTSVGNLSYGYVSNFRLVYTDS